MPLVSFTDLLADARRRGYAICYCESWNLESMEASLETAEELCSPTIVGFNGGSLMHPPRRKPENLSYYSGLVTAARKASVPVALLLNESDSLLQMEKALDLGFNAVMVDDEHLGQAEYVRMVQNVVEMAHARGASVEAQFGRLPSGAHSGDEAWTTEPAAAVKFVQETGIDALSVAVGNVHILTRGKAPIDLGILKRVHELLDLPLVLHGGTGIPAELAPQFIANGVAKLNFGTGLKQAYLAAVREKLDQYKEGMNPHPFLGWGGDNDIMVAGREAVKEKVRELLRAYGSAGKAASFSLAASSRRHYDQFSGRAVRGHRGG